MCKRCRDIMQPTRSAICVAPLAEQAARSLPPVLGPRLHSLCSLEAVPAFPRLPQCSWGAGRTPTQHAENDRRLSVDTVPTVPVATALQPVLVGAVQTPGQLIDVHVTSHTAQPLLRKYEDSDTAVLYFCLSCSVQSAELAGIRSAGSNPVSSIRSGRILRSCWHRFQSVYVFWQGCVFSRQQKFRSGSRS